MNKHLVVLFIFFIAPFLCYAPQLKVENFLEKTDVTDSVETFFKDNMPLLVRGNVEYYKGYGVGFLAYLGSLNKSAQVKVLVQGGKDIPLGFVGYFLADRAYKNANYFQKGDGVITSLGVFKDFQRHGHGKHLVKFALKDLAKQGCSVVKLSVEKNNIPAISLYKTLGFKIGGDADSKFYWMLYTCTSSQKS